MDLLQKELERKRKAIELAKKQSHISISSRNDRTTTHSTIPCTQDGTATDQSVTGGNGGGKKKRVYLKTSEMIKFQQEQEEAERRRVVLLEQEKESSAFADSASRTKRARTTDEDDAVTAGASSAAASRNSSHHHHVEEEEEEEKVCSDNHPFHRNVAAVENSSCSTSILLQHEQQDEEEMSSNTAEIVKQQNVIKEEEEEEEEEEHGAINQCKNHFTVMTSEQITVALRELGIPVRLFGETNDELRLVRLEVAKEHKRSIMAGMSDIDDFKLGSGHGIRNPFLQKDKNGGHGGNGGGGGGSSGNGSGGGDYNIGDYKDKWINRKLSSSQETLQDSNKSSSLMDSSIGVHQASVATTAAAGSAAAATAEEDIYLDNDPHKAIHRFFKLQLKQWEEDLVHRPEAVKRTLQGKNETKTLKQCKDYIRPLFKLCKNRRLEQSMMEHLVKIVKHCQEGEFVKANDAYMDVAIGRAAWPIGVTMVGIHARSGRSKIESNNVAHVMNSELQRKYLTSVKRLITYCQKKRTDVAPSKKVVNL